MYTYTRWGTAHTARTRDEVKKQNAKRILIQSNSLVQFALYLYFYNIYISKHVWRGNSLLYRVLLQAFRYWPRNELVHSFDYFGYQTYRIIPAMSFFFKLSVLNIFSDMPPKYFASQKKKNYLYNEMYLSLFFLLKQ